MPVKTVPPSGAAATVEKNIAALLKRKLLVGVPGDDIHEGSKAPNWVIAYVQEHGDDERHIPARPFLVPGIEAAKEAIAAPMAKGGAAVLAGASIAEAEKGMDAAGLIAVDAVRERIQEGPFVPLAPKTLQARRAKGFTGEKPLIRTGGLRNSVTYAIGTGGQN